MAIFVHVIAEIVISEGLDPLYRGEALFHLDVEVAFKLGFVDLTEVRWVQTLIKLHILEVILVLEVFIKSVFHFDTAEEVLNPMPLLIDIELIELILVLIRKLLRQK